MASVATKQIKHPYISCNTKIARGAAVITGTRVRVVDIAVEYERLGLTPDQIVEAHPHLNLEAIHDALSYYYENRASLDEKIRKEKDFTRKLSHKTTPRIKKTFGKN